MEPNNSIPDAISAADLAAFSQGPSMPPSPVLPSLRFASKGSGEGGSDLYLTIVALIDQAENRPTSFQVLTAVRGLLGTLLAAHPPVEITAETLQNAQSRLPPGFPAPTPGMVAALQQKARAHARKFEMAFDIVDELHTIWLDAAVGIAMVNSRNPDATLKRLQGTHGVVSDDMLASLGISREQFDTFAEHAKAHMEVSDSE